MNLSRNSVGIVLLLLATQVFAGLEPVLTSRKQGSTHLQIDTVVTVEDDKLSCIQTSSCNPEFTTTRLDGAVILGIDHDFDGCYTAFDVSVSLEVKYLDTSLSIITKNITLLLNYDPSAGLTTDDRAIFRVANAHKIEAKITNFTSSLSGGVMPENVYLENILLKERWYSINYTSTPTFSAMVQPQSDELTVSWSAIAGAEEYDLEWLYIDDFAQWDGTSVSFYATSDLEYSFFNDATRVSVKGTNHTIKQLYEHGYLLFRVRAVNRAGDEFEQRMEARWSSHSYGDTGFVINFGVSGYDYFQIDTTHQESFNWQWTSGFAEEGKSKTVISYFDGSLRSRQMVTHNSTDHFTIVGESFYDHVGRQSVSALPAPTGESVIKFYQNFNVSMSTGDPYSWRDFDTTDGVNLCETEAAGLDTISGVSRYYSHANPDKDGFNAYIPDANFYPLVQTEFMPDMTGRVRRQGGVGSDHQIGSGHETKYYYNAVAAQQELSSLFGVEVGNYVHYKKNMVIDPNGQVSVSYINPAGQVIATALAGKSPDNVIALGNDTAKRAITADLTPSNRLEGEGMAWVVNKVFSLSQPSAVNIDYRFTDIEVTTVCDTQEICYSCSYDLTLRLEDECGNLLIDQVVLGIKPFDTTCTVDSFDYSVGLTLDIGSYHLYKKLSVSERSFAQYEQVFLNNMTCVKSVEELYDSLVNTLVFTSCYMTCETCIDSLGSFEDFISVRLAQDNQDTLLVSGDSLIEIYGLEYGQYMDHCRLLCDTIDYCEGILTMILQDVSPGGQYMSYSYDASGLFVVDDTLSFLQGDTLIVAAHPKTAGDNWRNWRAHDIWYTEGNGDTSFVMYEGRLTRPNYLPAEVFLNNWKPSWANTLAKYHPEYCYYEWCILNEDANDFDYELSFTFTYEDAETKLLFNPLRINNADAPGTYSSMTEDPFFNSTYGSGLKTAATNKCNSYAIEGTSVYSIWDMAVIMTFCPDAESETEINTCLSANSFGSGDTLKKAHQWDYFKSMYRGIRGVLMDSARAIYANDSNCSNCFIGHNSENLYSTSCSTAFNHDAYLNKQKLFPSGNEALGVDLSDPEQDIIDAADTRAREGIANQCQKNCESYADYWMQKLALCDFDATDSLSIRDSLIRICALGCDRFSPLGSSNVAPYNEIYVTSTTFGDLLESFSIPNFRSKICTEDLLEFPLPYGFDLTSGEYPVMADDCFTGIVTAGSMPVCTAPTSRSAFQDVLEEIISNNKLVSLTMVDFSTFLSSGAMSSLDTLEQFFFISSSQTNYYRSHVDAADSNLVMTFIGNDGSSWDSCSVKIELHPDDKPLDFSTVYDVNNFFDLDYTCEDNINPYRFTIGLAAPGVTELAYLQSNCIIFCEAQDTFNRAQRLQDYLAREYCWNITEGQAETYCKMACGDTTAFEFVPSELTCKPACITCDELKEQRGFFASDYYGIYDLDDTAVESDTNFSSVYTQYMNAAMGINVSFNDLSNLWANCELYIDYVGSKPDTVPYGDYPNIYLKFFDQHDIYKLAKGCYMDWDTTVDSAWQDTLLQFLTLCSTPMFSPIAPPDTISCDSFQKEMAYQQAIYMYNQRLEQAKAEFRQNYYNQCIAISGHESFTLEYELKEFHYTLYYYDQAGNLIKTVPPQGVHLITNQDTLDQIDLDRQNRAAAIYANTPHHTFVTNYQYNSLNEIRKQTTPDGGSSEFFYDALGRMVVSQNAKQNATSSSLDSIYSYTRYDNLGRITEVGQAHSPDAITTTISGSPGQLSAWLANCLDFRQVTFTVYEDTLENPNQLAKFGVKGQENLRNRISHVYVYGDELGDESNAHLTAYSYDIHGNVKTMVQDFLPLTLGNDHYGLFKMEYDYDLISGNVNQVKYQQGANDQFFHKYEYDADNRIQSAYTSKDNLLWDEDARYYYYQHGPLARTEIGELKVQGVDYAYTIHGWLKGVNSATLDSSRDMGKDGSAGDNRYIPKDEFGFTLGYYQGDYTSITSTDPVPKFTLYSGSSSGWDNAAPSLYNGNIRQMTVAIAKFMEGAPTSKPIGYAYKYDQLNRIKEMNAYDSIDMAGNSWYVAAGALPYYHNRFTYDGNGNILTQVRKGGRTGPIDMDSLVYNYQTDNNKLAYVDDPVSSSNYGVDIDDQSSGNYQYDPIGNLISDQAEGIDSIKWNVYGKITHVYHDTNRGLPNLEFKYGPDGQRVIKRVFAAGTDSTLSMEYYVRDAQGNIMAIYDLTNLSVTKMIDSTYEKIIGRMVQEAGIDSFAQFIATHFQGNTTWLEKLEAYLPPDSMAALVDKDDVIGCLGDYMWQYATSCCDDCDNWGAKMIMDSLLAEADAYTGEGTPMFDLLWNCNKDKLILAYMRDITTGEPLLNSIDGLMNTYYGIDTTIIHLYNHFIQLYSGGTPPESVWLATSVDQGEILKYLKVNFAAIHFLSEDQVYDIIEEAIRQLGGDFTRLVRFEFTPCEFLHCVAACRTSEGLLQSYTNNPVAGCHNSFTTNFTSLIEKYGPIAPGIDASNYRGSPITTAGLGDEARERIVRCDPSAAFIVLYSHDNTVVDNFVSYFGSPIVDSIVAYFEWKHPYTGLSDPYSDAAAYLRDDVPMLELAEYLEKHFREHGSISSLGDFLWQEANAYGTNFDQMISDYMPDCALINCVVPELGDDDTREPLDSILFAPEDPFIFSQLFYCNSSIFDNKVVQNITDRFSNNLIATAYPNYFVNAIDKYPYTGLVKDLAAGDGYTHFYACHPKEIVRALLDLHTRQFMDELASHMALGNILAAFGHVNPPGADTAATVLQLIDNDQLIDYLKQNYSSTLDSVVSYFDGAHDENQGNPVLLHALTECQFKECLKDNWDSIVGSDTSTIYNFVRYNDWISIATSVFASYPDSFTKAFAYTYPTTRVADLLENWHYSLYAFMDGVESFYGAGMKDKIDGDTLVMTQYVRMKEFHLYGSSRLGILNQNDTLKRADLHYKLSLSDPEQEPELFVETLDYNKYTADSIYTLSAGKKMYEGSNHLGNVLVTFSDKRLGYCEGDTVYRYRADLRTANDYSAFGAPLDDRQWYSTADSGVYRFGFNGQEKDNEVSGLGNSNTAEFWQYDSRLGRRWNIDPVVAEWESPYATFRNSPVFYSDPKGDTPEEGKAAKSIKKYERKFNRMKRRMMRRNSSTTNDDVHAKMETKYNMRRWMWIAEGNNNDLDNKFSGANNNHSGYYHAGDLYRESKSEMVTPTVPAPIPLVQLDNWVLDAKTIGQAYILPSSGVVTLTHSVVGGTEIPPIPVNFVVYQGSTAIPTYADLTTSVAGPLSLNRLTSPGTTTFNADITGGNVVYIQTWWAEATVGNIDAFGSTVGAMLAPPPPPPALFVPNRYTVTQGAYTRNAKRLTSGTRRHLAGKREVQ